MAAGRIKAVCSSDARTEPKRDVGQGELRAGWGLVGDSHAGPPQPNRWQVSLLSWEAVEQASEAWEIEAEPGSFAENLSTEGLDTEGLQVGDRLEISAHAVLEVDQIGKPLAIAHTYSYREHSLLPAKGVFCSVVSGGVVQVGDEIRIVPRD
ncbi:MAG: MOSC domain-containing protein [Anaerolineae bacterium]|nr:MOSC domain-containing protein [Anaerolineae bacterium]